eukprot:5897604-Lingulodinium_polyedra.AAC.1
MHAHAHAHGRALNMMMATVCDDASFFSSRLHGHRTPLPVLAVILSLGCPPLHHASHGKLASELTFVKLPPRFTHFVLFQGSRGTSSERGRSPATQHK